MIDDLVEWLRAQLDKDERVAREAPQDNDVWQAVPTGRYSPAAWVRAVGDEDAWMVGEVSTLQQARHIALHDPARVRRDIEVKRRRLARHQPMDNGCCDYCHEWGGELVAWPCVEIRDDASVYADRPGYREEWRP